MTKITLQIALTAGVISAAAMGAASAMTTTTAPKNTEWCAVYRTGSDNCYFASEAQCAANVSGLGGFCRMSFYPAEQKRRI